LQVIKWHFLTKI